MSVIKYDNSLPIWCKGLSTFDESLNFFSGFGGLGLGEDLRNTEIYKQINKVEIDTETFYWIIWLKVPVF